MSGFTGTGRLTRLALRRDRVTLPAWLAGDDGLPGRHDRDVRRTRSRRPPTRSRRPPCRRTTRACACWASPPGRRVGGATMVRDYVTLAVLAALMSTFAVVRHTRQNEELGRAELLGATVVGRYAGLTAAVIVAVAADVVLAVLLGLAMLVNGQPASGSFAAGVAVAGGGPGLRRRGRDHVPALVDHARRQRHGRGGAGAVVPAQRDRQHDRHRGQPGAPRVQRLAVVAVPGRDGDSRCGPSAGTGGGPSA